MSEVILDRHMVTRSLVLSDVFLSLGGDYRINAHNLLSGSVLGYGLGEVGGALNGQYKRSESISIGFLKLNRLVVGGGLTFANRFGWNSYLNTDFQDRHSFTVEYVHRAFSKGIGQLIVEGKRLNEEIMQIESDEGYQKRCREINEIDQKINKIELDTREN